tara:strand:+ start:2865 stop:3629 length:765 start_codon:yes stop_codon:yes gene_type:complete
MSYTYFKGDKMEQDIKVVLITGGISGIGAKIATTLNEKGYKVIANYPPGREADAKHFKENNKIDIIEFDASSFDSTRTAFEHMTAKHGHVDVLVNNAGITRDSFLHKMELADWKNVLDVNLNSVFNCTKHVIDIMRKKGFGRIINLSSVNALKGQIGQTNYCASKAAIIGFTKALALESASKGITVNAIAPGYVDTEMTQKIDKDVVKNHILPHIPQGRFAQPSEIANLVAYLIGDQASYITGQTISINGGMAM